MKRFLRPAGQFLTTAVFTSASLNFAYLNKAHAQVEPNPDPTSAESTPSTAAAVVETPAPVAAPPESSPVQAAPAPPPPPVQTAAPLQGVESRSVPLAPVPSPPPANSASSTSTAPVAESPANSAAAAPTSSSRTSDSKTKTPTAATANTADADPTSELATDSQTAADPDAEAASESNANLGANLGANSDANSDANLDANSDPDSDSATNPDSESANSADSAANQAAETPQNSPSASHSQTSQTQNHQAIPDPASIITPQVGVADSSLAAAMPQKRQKLATVQNHLVAVALNYAADGRLAEADLIAQDPLLPTAVQTQLRQHITAIAAQSTTTNQSATDQNSAPQSAIAAQSTTNQSTTANQSANPSTPADHLASTTTESTAPLAEISLPEGFTPESAPTTTVAAKKGTAADLPTAEALLNAENAENLANAPDTSPPDANTTDVETAPSVVAAKKGEAAALAASSNSEENSSDNLAIAEGITVSPLTNGDAAQLDITQLNVAQLNAQLSTQASAQLNGNRPSRSLVSLPPIAGSYTPSSYGASYSVAFPCVESSLPTPTASSPSSRPNLPRANAAAALPQPPTDLTANAAINALPQPIESNKSNSGLGSPQAPQVTDQATNLDAQAAAIPLTPKQYRKQAQAKLHSLAQTNPLSPATLFEADQTPFNTFSAANSLDSTLELQPLVQPQSKALAFQPYLATSLHSKANVSLAFLDLVAAIAQESDPATPDAEAELKSVPVADTPAPQTVAFNTVAVPAVSNSINCYTPAPNAIGGQVVSTPTFGVLGMQFPLSIPSPITSLMGWRIHPISGDRRFHAGVDFGAPTGTPVVAAQAGRVAIADYIGGYGITVVLDHPTQGQQTLYAHLSQILVPPGTWVEAGAVIGRVGSTGNSTGPHLHFEVRQHTDRGWIAVNPISAFQP